jgi:peptide/nickel transport system ATP-binding protein
MTLSGQSPGAKRKWANELLEAVGMIEYANQKPTQLSGGQQQRIAIACALANRPTILLADEPTGEVDWPTAQRILALLRELRERYGLTIVMVTHDPRVAAQADRVIAIRDGRTSTETVRVEQDSFVAERAHTDGVEAALPVHVEELVVLDSAGRLQIPGDQRALARIGKRAKVELVDGGILIRPIDDDRIEVDEPTSEDGAETEYHSLYSAEPPAPRASQNGQGRTKWRLWRSKRNA